MIFNSVSYLIFLSLFVCFFWLIPRAARVWLILLASSMFYGLWRPEFLLIMLASAGTDFFAALMIEKTQILYKRRLWLALSLSVNLGLLCYFKYLMFFVDNAVVALNFFGFALKAPVFNVILPLGISFYTFEAISYVVDVYRRYIPAEKNFLMYGCFITFFPKLIAGPVLRASEILPQFSNESFFRLEVFVSGIRRIIFGLFLKVVLADNIAPLVDDGFLQPASNMSAIDVLTLAFLFGFQIYFDFAGYSSIAIGSARLIGINIPENFNFPYMSSSPREFWQRWNISLSGWIRDYLYLPLLGVKAKDRSAGGLAINSHKFSHNLRHPLYALFITWSIMGLWHGANWTFLIWGIYHATYIAAYRISFKYLEELPISLRIWGGRVITIILVMLAWIPFRATSLDLTFSMYGKLFSISNYSWLGMRENVYLTAACLLIAFILTYLSHELTIKYLKKRFLIGFLIDTLIMSIAFSLVFVFLRPISQFIYFQF